MNLSQIIFGISGLLIFYCLLRMIDILKDINKKLHLLMVTNDKVFKENFDKLSNDILTAHIKNTYQNTKVK